MNSAKTLGVEPVISAREMADPEVDHLGVMAYAAWFEHLKPRGSISVPVVVPTPPPSPVRAPSPPPPPPVTPPSEKISLLTEETQTKTNNTVSRLYVTYLFIC